MSDDELKAILLELKGQLNSAIKLGEKNNTDHATIFAKFRQYDDNIERFYGPDGPFGNLKAMVIDHEHRIRKVENAVVRNTVYSSVGAAVGAAVLTAVVKIYF